VKLPSVKWWEAVLWLLPMVLAVLLAVQRNLVFSKGDYGMWTEDSLPLFLWAVVSIALLLGTKPWSPASRYGSSIRYVGVVLAVCCAVFVLLCTTSWGRYKLYRFETLTANWGITNYDGVRLDSPIEREPGAGEYVARDPELRDFAFQKSGLDFLGSPRATAVVVSLELAGGTTFQELLQKPQGPLMLLGTLVNQANPDPWTDELSWFERPEQIVLSVEQGRTVVKRLSVEFEKLPVVTLENLLFVAMHYPELFEDGQRESLFEAWAAGFDDLQPLAVEGLVVRRQMMELLPQGKRTVNLSVTVTGGVPSTYYYRNVDKIARQMILGLVRSCGVQVLEAEPVDLEVVVTLSQVAHHTYSKPTYDYETYYEHRTSGRSINGYAFRTQKVAKQRQVITGHTEETSYAPVARITLTAGDKTMELPEMLLFWHHLRFDHENNRFLDLQNEKTYGRMWPFGLHKRLFEWERD
jgi:hypothetical protein